MLFRCINKYKMYIKNVFNNLICVIIKNTKIIFYLLFT